MTGKIQSECLILNEEQKQLAKKLTSLHITDSPNSQLPPHQYSQLRKGIICEKCRSFSISVKGFYCICQDCAHKEKTVQAILRSVKEFKLLFPTEKVTTNRIYDWCSVIPSKKRISRALSKQYKTVAVHQWAYYE